MAADIEPSDDLRGLLMECTAHLLAANGTSRGTGFFISDKHLLTCAHVVKGPEGASVEIQPFRRAPRKGVVTAIRGEPEDVAIVEVTDADGRAGDDDDQPAVVLDREIDDAETYYAAGFPAGDFNEGAGLEVISYRGHRRTAPDGAMTTLLVLESGSATVTSGMSGGAVLNPTNGAVVAVVRYSQDTQSDAGGGAIPIVRAAAALPSLAQYLSEPPMATRRWRDTLGQDRWLALGKRWGWRSQVDVFVEGTRSRWSVRVDPDDEEPQELTVRDLPDDVSEALAEALFRWAQHRKVRRTDEVRLLGRLLAAAVFPSALSSRVWRDRLADELLVRLYIDVKSDLFDVPWEFVTVNRHGQDLHVATESGLGLVRVTAREDEAPVSLEPHEGEALVLGIVVQPTAWQERMPTLKYPKEVKWPREGEIARRLHEAVSASGAFTFLSLPNPTPAEVDGAVTKTRAASSSIEVVHYIGFAQVRDGKEEVALVDQDGVIEWRLAADLVAWAARSGARVLVLEFALPPVGEEPDTMPPGTFLTPLTGRLNAIVFTRTAMHPGLFRTFNEVLYRNLGEGQSVEAAVQHARSGVYLNQFLGDAAPFGWFTLITGPQSDMRLVPAKVPDPTKSGTRVTDEPGRSPGHRDGVESEPATFERGQS
jgi:hypothetical protein